MEQRNMIMWVLLSVIVLLAMSSGVQAQELTEVNASDVLEQIEKGEDICLENARITGELDLSKIYLKTVHIDRPKWQLLDLGLEEELKIVESKITITNSVFENDGDFSNTLFRKPVDFYGIAFLGKTDFRGVNFGECVKFDSASFSSDAKFDSANFGIASFRQTNFRGNTNFFWR